MYSTGSQQRCGYKAPYTTMYSFADSSVSYATCCAKTLFDTPDKCLVSGTNGLYMFYETRGSIWFEWCDDRCGTTPSKSHTRLDLFGACGARTRVVRRRSIEPDECIPCHPVSQTYTIRAHARVEDATPSRNTLEKTSGPTTTVRSIFLLKKMARNTYTFSK